MLTSNRELMVAARSNLKGKWNTAATVYVVYIILTLLVSVIPRVGAIACIIIAGPMLVGLYIFYLSLIRGGDLKVGQLFEGFSTFGSGLAAYLLFLIFVILWSLLLIIPGIIAGLAYSQTFFLLADNRQMDGLEAIRLSKQMMQGKKWKLFCLSCRFIGWVILGVLTFGIGLLWIGPYIMASFAEFYEDVKKAGETEKAHA